MMAKFLVIFSLLFSWPFLVWADSDSCATPYINSNSSFYDDLSRLSGLGLINFMPGHGNITFSEAQRLIQLAIKKINKKVATREPSSSEKHIIAFLADMETRWRITCNNLYEINPLASLKSELVLAKISPRPYFQAIDAYYSPLTEYRLGRTIHPGSQIDFSSEHWARLTRYTSLYVSPLLQLNYFNDGGPQNYVPSLHQGYVSSRWGNTQIDIGRRELLWGQSRSGGFILSDNPRPIDALTISNPIPFDFERFGKFRYSFFLGNLGPEQSLPYPFLTGAKITYQPIEHFQFSIVRTLMLGGEGSPSISILDGIKEFFGARRQREFDPSSGRVNLSNSLSGFEMRGSLPFLRNLNLYSEIVFDDFTVEKAWKSLKQDTGILLGAEAGAIDKEGAWAGALEYRRTSDILYRHDVWQSGWVLNRHVMGDPLGSNGESLHTIIRKRFSNNRTLLRNDFFFEVLKSDVYTRSGTGGRDLIANGTNEYRIRNLFLIEHELSRSLSVQIQTGYEFIQNFNFIAGDERHDVLGLANLSWRPNISIRSE